MRCARRTKRKTKNKSGIKPFAVADGVVVDRNGRFQFHGTVRFGNRSRRLRESLHIQATRQNKQAAREAAEQLVADTRLTLGGVEPQLVAEVAFAYLHRPRKNGRPLGPTTVQIIKELAAKFGTRVLRDIPPEEFVQFVDQRHVGNSAEARERFLNGTVSFLNTAIAAGQYASMPAFVRDQRARNPSTRKTRPVERVGGNIISAILRSAHIANAMQWAVEEVTGARVSSVLFGCSLGDLDCTPGHMTLCFRDTKPGDDVPSALPESIRPLLATYLDWRQQQVRLGKVGPVSDVPLFLTPRGVPYKRNPALTGTRNKSAWNGAKRRAKALIEREYEAWIAACEAAGDNEGADKLWRRRADDLMILNRLTQHWFRHLLATLLGRRDPKAAMRQGGWRDPRSLSGYMMADAEYQRALVEERGVSDWRAPDWHKTDTQGDDQ